MASRQSGAFDAAGRRRTIATAGLRRKPQARQRAGLICACRARDAARCRRVRAENPALHHCPQRPRERATSHRARGQHEQRSPTVLIAIWIKPRISACSQHAAARRVDELRKQREIEQRHLGIEHARQQADAKKPRAVESGRQRRGENRSRPPRPQRVPREPKQIGRAGSASRRRATDGHENRGQPQRRGKNVEEKPGRRARRATRCPRAAPGTACATPDRAGSGPASAQQKARERKEAEALYRKHRRRFSATKIGSHGSSIKPRRLRRARWPCAVASPPPMHRLAMPRLSPCLRSAPISVTTMRAPDAPIGWPSAQAPPWTLTFSCGKPCSVIAAIVTTANASLIS